MGYYTGTWNHTGTAIVAHGFTGALHLWNRTPDGDLIPQPTTGGHCGPIVDATWAADGGCIVTVSTDQTSRLTTKLESTHLWSEIARPQVHGHDFSCVAAVPAVDGSYLYVSGSEEKVLRIFQAPRAFEDTLAMARNRPLPVRRGINNHSQHAGGLAPSTPAYGATLPALGLSQKAVYMEESSMGGSNSGENGESTEEAGLAMGGFNHNGSDMAPIAAPSAIAGPPLEEHLAGSTLWPEIHKLYGHGNEVYCVASHPSGRVLASACRAQSASTAGIMLWDTATWTACEALKAHTLTVTQLEFSPNGKFLASASRDRSVGIFLQQQSTLISSDSDAAPGTINANGAAPHISAPPPQYAMATHVQKAHSRIVWGVSWAPDSRLLATASRDGCTKIWGINNDGSIIGGVAAAMLPFGDGVRAVAFAPRELSLSSDNSSNNSSSADSQRKRCLVAVGLDGGEIIIGVVRWTNNNLLSLEMNNDTSTSTVNGPTDDESAGVLSCEDLHVDWKEIWRTSRAEKHAAAVRRLCWRTVPLEKGATFELASVSDDHSLRIFKIL